MKKNIKIAIGLIALLGLVFTKSNSQNTNCNVTVEFATVSEEGVFAPNHVLAVWIENDANQFVRTLKIMASERKQYLYTWNDETTGNTIDAITGATKTGHSSETIYWNGKDINQAIVPDGTYNIIVEFTEEHAQGPLLIIPFIKNTSDSDSIFNNAANFTNISINYDASLSSTIDEIMAEADDFGIYPNPITNESKIKIRVEKDNDAHLSIYSLNGQCIKDMGTIKLAGGDNFVELNLQKSGNVLPVGTYLLRLEYNSQIKVVKLVKQ